MQTSKSIPKACIYKSFCVSFSVGSEASTQCLLRFALKANANPKFPPRICSQLCVRLCSTTTRNLRDELTRFGAYIQSRALRTVFDISAALSMYMHYEHQQLLQIRLALSFSKLRQSVVGCRCTFRIDIGNITLNNSKLILARTLYYTIPY